MKHVLIIATLAALLISCGDDKFPEYVELKKLRVLALQAGAAGGAAEYSPGDVVTITPFVSDYYGGARALSYVAFACIDPGLAVGGEPSCAGVPGTVSVGTGVAATPATSRTGSTTTLSVTIPATILTLQSAQSSYNGVVYLVTYELTAGGETVRAFKRIVVSESGKAAKNNNPVVTNLLSSGAVVGALPGGEVDLSISYPGSSVEAYSIKTDDLTLQSAQEQLLTTWFITDGELEFYRTLNADKTAYTPPGAPPSGRSALLVGVTRDGRGGVSVAVHSY